jgi:hypothetical protein
MDAKFERNSLQAILAQALFATQEHEDLIGLPVGDNKVIKAVAVPICDNRGVAHEREGLVFLGRR